MPLPFLEKCLLRCDRLLVYVAMACTMAMMLLTTADALFRYFLNSPVLGAYEITEKFLMVAAIFLGLSYAYRGGALIRVTFLVDRLPAPHRRIADTFAHLVTLAFAIVFAFATVRQAWRTMDEGTTLATLPIPVGPAYFIAPLGFAVLTLFLALDLPKVRAGHSPIQKSEAPAA
jgi:TRAP-type C4-dicarboxylate transport system permease small subunit